MYRWIMALNGNPGLRRLGNNVSGVRSGGPDNCGDYGLNISGFQSGHIVNLCRPGCRQQ